MDSAPPYPPGSGLHALLDVDSIRRRASRRRPRQAFSTHAFEHPHDDFRLRDVPDDLPSPTGWSGTARQTSRQPRDRQGDGPQRRTGQLPAAHPALCADGTLGAGDRPGVRGAEERGIASSPARPARRCGGHGLEGAPGSGPGRVAAPVSRLTGEGFDTAVGAPERGSTEQTDRAPIPRTPRERPRRIRPPSS